MDEESVWYGCHTFNPKHEAFGFRRHPRGIKEVEPTFSSQLDLAVKQPWAIGLGNEPSEKGRLTLTSGERDTGYGTVADAFVFGYKQKRNLLRIVRPLYESTQECTT